MKKSVKKVLAAVLALALIALSFSACGGKEGNKTSGDNYAANNAEYFIGTTGPLTGDAASYGNSVKNGATIIVEADEHTDFSYVDQLGYTLRKEKLYKTNKHVFLTLKAAEADT